ncbi:MAG TPA: hypothetical protein EYP81_01900 [Thermodesulfobacteriaceae bacterium]|nr:hypothetical protein [Thermodesulfobacteriaceae bacterium]
MKVNLSISGLLARFETGNRSHPSNEAGSKADLRPGRPLGPSGREVLDFQELLEIARLRRIDQMVRAHERAHLVAGGELVIGGPHYVYKIGPDGRQYAVGGDVQIDTSAVPGDPEATLHKAERIIRAALAPLNPSPQDLRVAMRAQMMAIKARMEIIREDQAQAKEAKSENS